jgi:lysozyme
MALTRQGLDLLIEREGLRTRAYRDTKGIWTIGVGHTGPEVHDGLVWSEAQCREVFARDVLRFERSVDACVKVPLEPHQRDALASFAFNVGENALPHGSNGGPSSILRALNAGDYEGAGRAFNNWMADPEVRTRRAGERDQFLGIAFEARRPV